MADSPTKKTCSACGKERDIEKFRSDKRHKDGYASTCFACAKRGMSADGELQTMDLPGVDILAEGGPYFGQGSPEDGDFFDVEYLQRLADDTNKMMDDFDELKSPNKLGHSNEQKLAKNSGFVDEDEMPAVGWLSNFRVEAIDGVNKLLCDVKKVPAKLGALIKAGGFRTRSVEISRLTAQTDGKKYEVISGLAWLGAKAPAVRTLDDIIALYMEGQAESAAVLMSSDDDRRKIIDRDEMVLTRIVDLSEGDVVWDPDGGLNALQSRIRAALHDTFPTQDGMGSMFWVMDVSTDGKQAIVEDYANAEAWLVSFTEDDGEIKLQPRDEWTLARPAWVEAGKEYAEETVVTIAGTVSTESELADTIRDAFADTSRQMADENRTEELTDEQVEAVASTLGIDEADPEARRAAVFARFETPEDGSGDGNDDEGEKPAVVPPVVNVAPVAPVAQMSAADAEKLRADAAAGATALRMLHESGRDAEIKLAIESGKVDPAKKQFWSDEYDRDAERTKVLLSEMPVNPDLLKVYGKDESGLDADSRSTIEDEAYIAFSEAMGHDTSKMPSVVRAGV